MKKKTRVSSQHPRRQRDCGGRAEDRDRPRGSCRSIREGKEIVADYPRPAFIYMIFVAASAKAKRLWRLTVRGPDCRKVASQHPRRQRDCGGALSNPPPLPTHRRSIREGKEIVADDNVMTPNGPQQSQHPRRQRDCGGLTSVRVLQTKRCRSIREGKEIVAEDPFLLSMLGQVVAASAKAKRLWRRIKASFVLHRRSRSIREGKEIVAECLFLIAWRV